ncbi:MAG: glycoside hydrolase family 2, partial [Bacteroidaceae bacterium]|nr:glycoside hydrolase family 2 [Bacteroidaceae bacterium]
MKKTLLSALFCLCFIACFAASDYSVAGFFPLENSGRLVYNFNQGWRFCLGDAQGAEAVDYDDRQWEVVCVPHSPLLTPVEGSGGRNYQGVVWYRKHFSLPKETAGMQVILHFEAVMGKQKVYVNGKLAKEHLGGYLPIQIDLSACGVKPGEDAVVAVMADNSDDKTYPPGKKQSQLDFCYHGGIYRDVWLIAKNDIAITDAVERNQVAGGGVFIHYANISERSAEMFIDVEVKTLLNPPSRGTSIVQAKIIDAVGNVIKTLKKKIKIGGIATAKLSTTITNPVLWSPENPYLYSVEISVLQNGKSMDGGIVKTGIRSFEFKGQDGFWLNGKPYRKLIGGNRHQDFAYVGNALPNSQQWRDVKRLKESGMNIIRVAHYPQDPSFMDACDELGIFVIVATPGWQYWNKDAKFAELVHQNTREIIRRDRNHPCVLMWEPILNETRYPADFALQALQITKDEYPYQYRPVAAADMNSAGVKENYDVLYGWTTDLNKPETPTDKCIFTREFGEMVDDWYAHNTLNRAARAWGEKPMLTTAT